MKITKEIKTELKQRLKNGEKISIDSFIEFYIEDGLYYMTNPKWIQVEQTSLSMVSPPVINNNPRYICVSSDYFYKNLYWCCERRNYENNK